MRVVEIDHVQVAIPAGGEDAARRFYRDVLGLEEVPKPRTSINRRKVPALCPSSPVTPFAP